MNDRDTHQILAALTVNTVSYLGDLNLILQTLVAAGTLILIGIKIGKEFNKKKHK